MIAFRVACVPPTTTHQHKKILRIKLKDGRQFTKFGDRPELTNAKAMLDSLLLPFQPEAPISGPVSLSIGFTWPWLKSQSKRIKSMGRIPHTSRPDCSNLAKTFEDRLVALRFIEDDNAVVQLIVRKWWGDEPGISVEISNSLDTSAHSSGYPARNLLFPERTSTHVLS